MSKTDEELILEILQLLKLLKSQNPKPVDKQLSKLLSRPDETPYIKTKMSVIQNTRVVKGLGREYNRSTEAPKEHKDIDIKLRKLRKRRAALNL